MHVCVMNRDGTVMHLQDEVVVDDDMRRVAAIGVAAALLVLAVISGCEDTVAKLLEPLATARAGAAGIDHAAHGRDVAGLESLHLRADRRDTTDDLVARQDRIERVLPFVADEVKVGVADAAIKDFDGDVLRPRITALESERRERLVGGLGRITGAAEHGGPLSEKWSKTSLTPSP